MRFVLVADLVGWAKGDYNGATKYIYNDIKEEIAIYFSKHKSL